MAHKRKYAIPYNGTNPVRFLQEAVKRKEHIDHVYCELPTGDMVSHVRLFLNGNDGELKNDVGSSLNKYNYLNNCSQFLALSKDKLRRFCPLNAMYYRFDTKDELDGFVKNVARIVGEFGIDGLIISDYRVATGIRELLPEVEIHTSCNGYQWNLKQMEIWRDKVGVKVFNPPREILRNVSRLKEMHDAGFRLKCIVNEGCLYGCPNSFCHQLAVSLNAYAGINCIQNGMGDVFKANWILPRWQKHYDKYVDIYKIAGRMTNGDFPFFVLDAYLSERNDLPLSDIMISGTSLFLRYLPKNVSRCITLDKIPDKLLTCECRECNRCGLCEKILRDLVPKDFWKMLGQ